MHGQRSSISQDRKVVHGFPARLTARVDLLVFLHIATAWHLKRPDGAVSNRDLCGRRASDRAAGGPSGAETDVKPARCT